VDYDPIVLAHARALLTSHQASATEYIDSDLRDTQTILGEAAKLLDFTKPVAVTLISILHAVPDGDDPHAIVARLLAAVPSGSYLAISHMGADLMAAQTLREMDEVWKRSSQQQYTPRDRDQVALLRRHRPGGAGPGAGRRMAPGTRGGRRAQDHHVVRGRPQTLMDHVTGFPAPGHRRLARRGAGTGVVPRESRRRW
jgi:hypothetical protein